MSHKIKLNEKQTVTIVKHEEIEIEELTELQWAQQNDKDDNYIINIYFRYLYPPGLLQ